MDTYNDTRIAYIGLDGTNSVSSTSRTPPTVRPTTYFLTQAGQWAAKFSYGTVKGSSVCTAGYSGEYSGGATTNENLTSTSTGSGTCWCKMTSPATSYWASLGYETSCYAMCASQCADYVGAFDTMRATMYGTVGN